ncbi:SDR family oxidoreductase [Paenibacillus aurantius]|uniref:UDP-glucose 4-epimerase n=1 Tax=Paenibacillus aurantius TaxID=2918900 RepID=A0AA96LDT1_9BACL|nr:SDR family oxidoreductase [Paenibacillus aurantius]WNQ11932.1 SDR family oxidoreductase [Paenibacillus aurantius]
MKLLILGGTKFLGRHLAEAALKAGHEVTLFNRGLENPGLFPEAEHLTGDRDGRLDALKGRRWDAVIDTSGFVPRQVRATAGLLADFTDHYTFISSLSAYADLERENIREEDPPALLTEPGSEDVSAHYGALKALCEMAAEEAMPGRVLHIRPGLIVGPFDPSDRFTYWPHRIAQGGEVVVPAPPERQVQVIDVRDLADWILRMIAEGETGLYNASGGTYTMERVVEECRRVSGSDARFIWVSEEFLLDREVGVWIELPLWIPSDSQIGLFAADSSKAFHAGLSIRRLPSTIRDTLAWSASRQADTEWKAGLEAGRERELLADWKASHGEEAHGSG